MRIRKYIILLAWSLGAVVLNHTPAWSQSDLNSFLNNNKKYQDVVVKKVDQINIITLEDDEQIKLIGLKAPEADHKPVKKQRDEHGFVIEDPATPLTSVEETGLTFVQELLEGQHVRLELDVTPKDENFVTLAYVFLLKDHREEIFVNEEIIRRGFCFLSTHPTNTKYNQKLRAAYQEARQQKRGLHGQ